MFKKNANSQENVLLEMQNARNNHNDETRVLNKDLLLNATQSVNDDAQTRAINVSQLNQLIPSSVVPPMNIPMIPQSVPQKSVPYPPFIPPNYQRNQNPPSYQSPPSYQAKTPSYQNTPSYQSTEHPTQAYLSEDENTYISLSIVPPKIPTQENQLINILEKKIEAIQKGEQNLDEKPTLESIAKLEMPSSIVINNHLEQQSPNQPKSQPEVQAKPTKETIKKADSLEIKSEIIAESPAPSNALNHLQDMTMAHLKSEDLSMLLKDSFQLAKEKNQQSQVSEKSRIKYLKTLKILAMISLFSVSIYFLLPLINQSKSYQQVIESNAIQLPKFENLLSKSILDAKISYLFANQEKIITSMGSLEKFKKQSAINPKEEEILVILDQKESFRKWADFNSILDQLQYQNRSLLHIDHLDGFKKLKYKSFDETVSDIPIISINFTNRFYVEIKIFYQTQHYFSGKLSIQGKDLSTADLKSEMVDLLKNGMNKIKMMEKRRLLFRLPSDKTIEELLPLLQIALKICPISEIEIEIL